MEQPTEQAGCRYVELWVLLRHLDAMSHGAEQWIGLPLAPSFVTTEGEVQRYILVGYSNSEPTNLPNPLVYLVPIELYQASDGGQPKLLCSIGADLVVPLSKGLYWSGDVLRYDQLEDGARFCGPLMKQLSQPVPTPVWGCTGTSERWNPDTDRQTMDGIAYPLVTLALLCGKKFVFASQMDLAARSISSAAFFVCRLAVFAIATASCSVKTGAGGVCALLSALPTHRTQSRDMTPATVR